MRSQTSSTNRCWLDNRQLKRFDGDSKIAQDICQQTLNKNRLTGLSAALSV
jgi:hypothetical protein